MATTTNLIASVEDALRAPSVHNTQPWRWRIRSDAIDLFADWDRHLAGTDPDRRDLVISCGVALHHLEVALAARGMAVCVRRMPQHEDRGHLATVAIRIGAADSADAALYRTIPRRHTDRRRLSHRRVPREQLQVLVEQAARTRALLIPVTDPAIRQRLVATLDEAAHLQTATPGHAGERQHWTHRYGGHNGISPGQPVQVSVGGGDGAALRPLPSGRLDQPYPLPGNGLPDDAAELLVITTAHDDPLGWLHAGEATSAVLLAATELGLATTPLSQGLEVEATRHEIRRSVLQVPEHPQLIIRVGWPATGAEHLPATARRGVRSVLVHV